MMTLFIDIVRGRETAERAREREKALFIIDVREEKTMMKNLSFLFCHPDMNLPH